MEDEPRFIFPRVIIAATAGDLAMPVARSLTRRITTAIERSA